MKDKLIAKWLGAEPKVRWIICGVAGFILGLLVGGNS